MIEQPVIKFKSRIITVLIALTLLATLMGIMGVLRGGMAQDAEDVLGRGPEIGKLHVYPYPTLIAQVIFYATLFFIPGFVIVSAIYPALLLPEKVVLSTAVGVLLYSFYVNIFLVTGSIVFFVMSQIVWDLFYMVLVTVIGFIIWGIRLSRPRR
jgi:hypothetical protein